MDTLLNKIIQGYGYGTTWASGLVQTPTNNIPVKLLFVGQARDYFDRRIVKINWILEYLDSLTEVLLLCKNNPGYIEVLKQIRDSKQVTDYYTLSVLESYRLVAYDSVDSLPKLSPLGRDVV